MKLTEQIFLNGGESKGKDEFVRVVGRAETRFQILESKTEVQFSLSPKHSKPLGLEGR